MGTLRIELSMEGADKFRELSKKLRGPAKKKLRADLRSKISDAGKPVLDEVRERVRTLPVTSHGGGAKRRQLFNSVQAGRRAHASGKDVRAAAVRAAKRGTGLRETIAKATKLQITAKGVRFVVRSDALPESQQGLPWDLDSAGGWRHPVFGDTTKWVAQKGQPWFASTIKKREAQFRRAALDAMEQTIEELER